MIKSLAEDEALVPAFVVDDVKEEINIENPPTSAQEYLLRVQ